MKDERITLFIDIDGTISFHQKDATSAIKNQIALLPGVLDKFNDWSSKGYCIILTTARKESMRETTEKQLKEAGLFWDYLLMGIGSYRRILINDKKQDTNTAIAINLPRNEGFTNIDQIYTNMLNYLGEEGEHSL